MNIPKGNHSISISNKERDPFVAYIGFDVVKLVCKGAVVPDMRTCPNLLSLTTDFSSLIFSHCPRLRYLNIKVDGPGYYLQLVINQLPELTCLVVRGKGSIVYTSGMFDKLTHLKIYTGIENSEELKLDLTWLCFVYLGLPEGFQGRAIANEEYVLTTL